MHQIIIAYPHLSRQGKFGWFVCLQGSLLQLKIQLRILHEKSCGSFIRLMEVLWSIYTPDRKILWSIYTPDGSLVVHLYAGWKSLVVYLYAWSICTPQFTVFFATYFVSLKTLSQLTFVCYLFVFCLLSFLSVFSLDCFLSTVNVYNL